MTTPPHRTPFLLGVGSTPQPHLPLCSKGRWGGVTLSRSFALGGSRWTLYVGFVVYSWVWECSPGPLRGIQTAGKPPASPLTPHNGQKMAAPRPKMFAELKKAFSATHGCSIWTARRNADANTLDWQKFIAAYGMEAAKKVHDSKPTTLAEAGALQVMSPASPTTVEPPPQADIPDADLPKPALIVKQIWQVYLDAVSAWGAAMQAGDRIGSLTFGQASIKALEAYYAALRNHEAWELSAKTLIPLREVRALDPFIRALALLVRGFPADIAVSANPAAPQLARAAGDEWISNRFTPQVNSLIDRLLAVLPEDTI